MGEEEQQTEDSGDLSDEDKFHRTARGFSNFYTNQTES